MRGARPATPKSDRKQIWVEGRHGLGPFFFKLPIPFLFCFVSKLLAFYPPVCSLDDDAFIVVI